MVNLGLDENSADALRTNTRTLPGLNQTPLYLLGSYTGGAMIWLKRLKFRRLLQSARFKPFLEASDIPLEIKSLPYQGKSHSLFLTVINKKDLVEWSLIIEAKLGDSEKNTENELTYVNQLAKLASQAEEPIVQALFLTERSRYIVYTDLAVKKLLLVFRDENPFNVRRGPAGTSSADGLTKEIDEKPGVPDRHAAQRQTALPGVLCPPTSRIAPLQSPGSLPR